MVFGSELWLRRCDSADHQMLVNISVLRTDQSKGCYAAEQHTNGDKLTRTFEGDACTLVDEIEDARGGESTLR